MRQNFEEKLEKYLETIQEDWEVLDVTSVTDPYIKKIAKAYLQIVNVMYSMNKLAC